MSKRGWLTQDAIPPRITVAISLPDDEEWRAQFMGAFLLLTGADNWEVFGDLSPEQMAAEWLDIWLQFVGGQTSMIPVGTILEFGGSTLPDGFLWARGGNVSRETYSRLWDEYGETYGPGDGVTTFGLPDKRERVGVGLLDEDPNFGILGDRLGEQYHTLTLDELAEHGHTQASHTHIQNPHTHTQNPHSHIVDRRINTTGFASNIWAASNAIGTVQSDFSSGVSTAVNQNATPTNQNAEPIINNAGSSQAHNNIQPSIVLNYIIKY